MKEKKRFKIVFIVIVHLSCFKKILMVIEIVRLYSIGTALQFTQLHYFLRYMAKKLIYCLYILMLYIML